MGIENKRHDEQDKDMSSWIKSPIQPPEGLGFRQVKVLNFSDIQEELIKPRHMRKHQAVQFKMTGLKGSTITKDLLISPNLRVDTKNNTQKPDATFILKLLIESREKQLIVDQMNNYYYAQPDTSNDVVIDSLLDESSFISRMLIVAGKPPDTYFIGRKRPTGGYGGWIEIPGGHLERENVPSSRTVEWGKTSSISYKYETWTVANEREYFEEFSNLSPVSQVKPGTFITFVHNTDFKAYLELTELAVLDIEELRLLEAMSNLKAENTGNMPWGIFDVDKTIKSNNLILPTTQFVINRLMGTYSQNYNSWLQYGEYIPHNKSYFETRAQSLI